MPDAPVRYHVGAAEFWRSLSISGNSLCSPPTSPSRLAPPPSGEAIIINIIGGRPDRPRSIPPELRTTSLLNGDAGQQPQRRPAGSCRIDLRRHSATRRLRPRARPVSGPLERLQTLCPFSYCNKPATSYPAIAHSHRFC